MFVQTISIQFLSWSVNDKNNYFVRRKKNYDERGKTTFFSPVSSRELVDSLVVLCSPYFVKKKPNWTYENKLEYQQKIIKHWRKKHFSLLVWWMVKFSFVTRQHVTFCGLKALGDYFTFVYKFLPAFFTTFKRIIRLFMNFLQKAIEFV